ncbi:MAG: imidazole glycerol phosphate synthase subunit HisH [Rhodospirillales bacterium]
MIGIVDYGLGNLASVAGAVEKTGYEPVITADAETLGQCEKLILPGVGAFGDGMANLRARGLDRVLDDLVIGARRPVLGVCLGFQLMARGSDEFGTHKGLGWIDADIAKLAPPGGLRTPHVGWNDLILAPSGQAPSGQAAADHPMWDGLDADPLVYFVHSHHMVNAADGLVTAVTDYGGPVTAAFAKDNIWGTQFHPEKSQRAGLRILENFLGRA